MTSSDLRCPSCGAQARPDADWCTLCYAAMRAPAAEPTTPAESQPAESRPAESQVAESIESIGATPHRPRGRHSKATQDTNTTTNTAVAADVAVLPDIDAMLAQLAAESHSPLSSVSGRVGSGGRKTAIIVGGVVAVGILVFIVMSAIGALL